MSAMTRLRATTDNIPTSLIVEYYTQRASAGLIISEGTAVSPMGIGYAQVPGIWSQQQIEAWKAGTASVHARGGRIFQQLWHVGRISVWGAGRVGNHISPRPDKHDMFDANPVETFGYLAREAGRRQLAFFSTRIPRRRLARGPDLKREFGSVYIAN
jgi:2,4-dienoyl-CoA reductase-like NADH-dependent reductase (Old Yellow Enzyme family)